MDLTLFFIQILNGIQFGLMLFLMSAGLTLVVGIMNFINLAHGSLYMIGAYMAALIQQKTGSFFIAVLIALPSVVLLGFLLETSIFKRFYKRDHLDQVLATFAMILFFNELIRIVFGSAGYFMDILVCYPEQSLFFPEYIIHCTGLSLLFQDLSWRSGCICLFQKPGLVC